MSHHIPTVRVANPAAPDTYMTINASDLTEAHDLWPDQAAGYVPPKPRRYAVDPAERDLAAEIMGRLVAKRLGLTAEGWGAMSGPARLDSLRAYEMDVAEEPSAPPATESGVPAVAKGPRGLWYVMDGERRVSRGFADEVSAEVERQLRANAAR